MSCVPHAFLALSLFLVIGEGGGRCSPYQKAICDTAGRMCFNGKCTECLPNSIEVKGKCMVSNDEQDLELAQLENCDPAVDADCRRKLEEIRSELLFKFVNRDRDGSDNSEHLSKSTEVTGMSDVTTSSNSEHLSKSTEVTGMSDVTTSSPSTGFERKSLNIKEETSKKEKIHMEGMSEKIMAEDKHPDKKPHESDDDIPDVYFLVIIIACTLLGVAGIALSGYCWYKLHHSDEKDKKSDYIPGIKKQSTKHTPSKNGDHRLDYKAEMYHYAQTKNRLALMEQTKSDHLSSGVTSNDDDDDDDAEDYTVYECPGLAPTADMTVTNPLFSDQEVSVSDEGRGPSTVGTHDSSTYTPTRSASR